LSAAVDDEILFRMSTPRVDIVLPFGNGPWWGFFLATVSITWLSLPIIGLLDYLGLPAS